MTQAMSSTAGFRVTPRHAVIVGLVILAWLMHLAFCEWTDARSAAPGLALFEFMGLAIGAAHRELGFTTAFFCGIALPVVCLSAAAAVALYRPRLRFPSLRRRLEELQKGDAPTRLAAAEALARMGPHAAEAVPVLARALADESLEVRQMVARALAKLGRDALPAVQALELALEDRAAAVRELAARALGKIGSPAAKAVPALENLLKDPHELVRLYAMEAIERIRGNRAQSDTSVL